MPKLLFAGDLVLKTKKERLVSEELEKLIKNHDVASCNFEAPIEGFGQPLKKIGPNLSQPDFSVALLREAGFNMASLANNHIFDLGKEGLEGTRKLLSDFDILGAGSSFKEAYGLVVKEIGGVKFGFLSFAESGFGAWRDEAESGFAWINHEEVDKIVAQSKKEVDVLIVQAHAGAENFSRPLPEWRRRYRELIDGGADIVVGHHPHVMQGQESYKSGHIFYSLGNFIFERDNPSQEWTKGFLLSLSYNGARLEKFEMIFIDSSGSSVEIDKSEATEDLSKTLAGDYQEKIDAEILAWWHKHYKHLFQVSLNGYGTWRGLVRSLLNFFRGIDVEYLYLYHNLSIESHRYVAERAAKLLMK